MRKNITSVDLLVQTYGLKKGLTFTYAPGSGIVGFKTSLFTHEELLELLKVADGYELRVCFVGEITIFEPTDDEDQDEPTEEEPVIEELEKEEETPPLALTAIIRQEEGDIEEIAEEIEPGQEETPEIIEIEEKPPEEVQVIPE